MGFVWVVNSLVASFTIVRAERPDDLRYVHPSYASGYSTLFPEDDEKNARTQAAIQTEVALGNLAINHFNSAMTSADELVKDAEGVVVHSRRAAELSGSIKDRVGRYLIGANDVKQSFQKMPTLQQKAHLILDDIIAKDQEALGHLNLRDLDEALQHLL